MPCTTHREPRGHNSAATDPEGAWPEHADTCTTPRRHDMSHPPSLRLSLGQSGVPSTAKGPDPACSVGAPAARNGCAEGRRRIRPHD